MSHVLRSVGMEHDHPMDATMIRSPRPVSAALFSAVVLSPIDRSRRILGERLWDHLEPFAGAIGTALGYAGRLLLREEIRARPVDAVLEFTALAEATFGIEGTNEVVNERDGRRRVHRCPYAESLESMPQFCWRLGCIGGVKAVDALVPGAEFEITKTMSRGDPYCEYLYRVPHGGSEKKV